MTTSKRGRILKYTLIALISAGLIGGTIALRAKPQKSDEKKGPPAALEFLASDIAAAAQREIDPQLLLTGSLEPVVHATVKAKAIADVLDVRVREGEQVKAGQLLATLDLRDLRARYESQAAQLEEAKARLALAEKTRQQNKNLLDRNFISQNAYDTVANQNEVTLAQKRAAEAQVNIARRALDDANARSPIAGIVAKRLVQPGERVATDAPLFEIVDLSKMQIPLPVPVTEIARISMGQSVDVRVEGLGETPLKGRVERISPTTETGSRAVMAYVVLDNPKGQLKGGMFSRATLTLDRRGAVLAVPSAAVRGDAAKASFVYKVVDGKLVEQNVKTGLRNDEAGYVEITSGLAAGDQIVVGNMTGLRPGLGVNVKQPVAPKS